MTIPPHIDCSGYIDPSIDPSTLGFLLISLGGSRAYDPTHSKLSTDWDGIGIVSRRENIYELVKSRREKLAELLMIDQEECPSWENFDSPYSSKDNWHVLRFSGRGKDGTKRTIKIWSLDSLIATSSSPHSIQLGVLSSRRLCSFPRFHPEDGNTLFIYQPRTLLCGSTSLCILEDADFFLPDSKRPPATPGVTCDLLLTSIPVYTDSADVLELIKSQLLSKWIMICGSDISDRFLDLFYASKKFSSAHRRRLLENLNTGGSTSTRVQELKEQLLQDFCLPSPYPVSISTISHVSPNERSEAGYTKVYFISRSYQSTTTLRLLGLEQCSEDSETPFIKSGFVLIDSMTPSVQNPFSSNSISHYARFQQDNVEREAFVKSGPGVAAEFSIIPAVKKHFVPSLLQNVLEYKSDIGLLVFDRFHGKSLCEIRLDLDRGSSQAKHETLRWLAEIELFRSEQVLTAHLSTLCTIPGASDPLKQTIHRFYYERLHLNRRMKQFYEGKDASFLWTEKNELLTLDEFLSLPLVVNGKHYPSLEQQFRRAEVILDPRGPHLQQSSTSFGLGDGHGGNLMVNMDEPMKLRFIDYEVSGYHNPILDQAKPLYLDAFLRILYKDLFLPTNDASAQWCVTNEAITIDCAIDFDQVDRVLAFIKLDCVLRPILERLAMEVPEEVGMSIELLGAALFTNSLLMRDFSKLSAEMFFLNCAVGTLLMADLKLSLRLFFGWDQWPVEVENFDIPESLAVHQNSLFGEKSDDIWALIYDAILDQTIGVSSLEPETVCLKRLDDTLQVHRRFSRNVEESADKIIARIGKARKMGMKIAPHTCIRESIFAEPRIDYHFLYQSVFQEACHNPDGKHKKLVDVGCCMGSDIRKLIVDGFEANNILGIDLEQGFFEIGKMMYNDTFKPPFKFRQVDVLSNDFYTKNARLESCFDFVHSANVLHLFDPDKQLQFLQVMAFLVKPGGCLWGRQVGLADDEDRTIYRQPSGKGARFSASEFKILILDATGWAEDDIVYQSQLVEYTELRDARRHKKWVLQWSVRVPSSKKPQRYRFAEVLDG